MIRRLPFILSVFLGLSVLTTSGALAQDDAARERARAEFARGVERYEAGDHQGALEAFQEAYRLAPHPSVRVNMANCYEELGRPLEAMFHFERFLAEAENARPAQRREVEAALQRLRGRVGEVSVRVQPEGALVTIDDNEPRRAPLAEPIRMTPGNHTIEVSMEGYATVRREFIVEAGQPANVAVTLERAGSGAEPAGPAGGAPVGAADSATGTEPAAAGSTAGANVAGDTEIALVPGEPSGGGGIGTPVLVAGGITAALVVGAVVTGVTALGANSDFEDAVADCDRGRGDAAACAEGHDAADTASTLALVTDILVAGAVVGAGITTYLYLTQSEGGTERARTPRVTPVATPHGGAVVLSGSF